MKRSELLSKLVLLYDTAREIRNAGFTGILGISEDCVQLSMNAMFSLFDRSDIDLEILGNGRHQHFATVTYEGVKFRSVYDWRPFLNYDEAEERGEGENETV